MAKDAWPGHTPRDHGGDADAAIARFGGKDWIDLSTGINRVPYPLPALPPESWTALPTRSAMRRLIAAAATAYGTDAAILPLAGAQAAIQMIPRLGRPGRARILSPTYNEHAASLAAAGWQVEAVTDLPALAGADLAVVVNPNNPDGRCHEPASLRALATRVGRLIVDESFADARPDLSLAGFAGRDGLIVLRSFGKFYGLAGLRLGFALGPETDIATLAERAGPWPVSGMAIEIGAAALADTAWRAASIARLEAEAAELDRLASDAGWQPLGGTCLFRLYEAPDAAGAQARLAGHRIWSRIFPYSQHWLRLGLPGGAAEWARVRAAFA